MAWLDEVRKLADRLGRDPTTDELIEMSRSYKTTPAEIEEQRESWVRAMMPTGDPRFD
jgi:beta-xylosidase